MSAASPNARRQLRSARTLLVSKKLMSTVPVRERESIQGVYGDEKKYRTRRAEDLSDVVQIIF
jgi:hypothetical protein